jgi:fido (protein-threonine AMPylation protein)
VQLHSLLGDTRYRIEHKTLEPLEIAVRFHHRLVHIHLFPNGNGRHARIAADELLRRACGADPIDWSGGYELQSMNVRRQQYIAALQAADAGNFGPLRDFAARK